MSRSASPIAQEESWVAVEESEKEKEMRLAAIQRAIDLEAVQLGKKFQDLYGKSDPSLDASHPYLANVLVNVKPENEDDVIRFMSLFWSTLSTTPKINDKNPNAAKLKHAVEAFKTNPPVIQLLFVLPDKVVVTTSGHLDVAGKWTQAVCENLVYRGTFLMADIFPLPQSSSFKDVDMHWRASCAWKNKFLQVEKTEEEEELIFGDDHIF